MITLRPQLLKTAFRIPYAVRRVPLPSFGTLVSSPAQPQAGDIALARLEKIGKNTRLELAEGRAANLHEGDTLAVVFGNRYATEQFEGYAAADGDACDLLSMAGVCGLVKSKHAEVSYPSKLRLLGTLADAEGCPLRLRDYALKPVKFARLPHIVVVCGSSMDAGKTHTAMSLIVGLRAGGQRVAAIKLTGTAAGRDTWSLLDAGAVRALGFVDGGFPSTYLASLEDLLSLWDLLLGHAVANEADWVVVEIADGLLQRETSALLQCDAFTSIVNAWIFATSDPLGAVGGMSILRDWGIEPVAISGVVSMSPLASHEIESATGIRCLTAKELQLGKLNGQLMPQKNGRTHANGNGVPMIAQLSILQ